MLSERIRPGVEAAPWVCEEIRKLEEELAELRARVRPGVEEIAEIIYKDWYHIQSSNYTSIAEAIHAILPPVPKVLSVEEIVKCIDRGTDEYVLVGGEWLSHEAKRRVAKAIHKATGGD